MALHIKSTNTTIKKLLATLLSILWHYKANLPKQTIYKPLIPKDFYHSIHTTASATVFTTALHTKSTHKTFYKPLAMLLSLLLHYLSNPLTILFINHCHYNCITGFTTALHAKSTHNIFFTINWLYYRPYYDINYQIYS